MSEAKPESTPRQQSLSSRLRPVLSMPEVGVLIPLILLSLLFYALKPVFLSANNISAILRAVSFVGIIAIGQTFLMISGAFDLSVGSTAGLCAIVCSYLMVNLQVPPALAVIIGVGVGGLVGLVNSFVVLKLGVPAFIATLGMLYIARGASYVISKGYTIYPLPESVQTFGLAEPLGISWTFLILIGLGIVADLVLRRTVYGRTLYATGGNKEVARLAGINTNLVSMSAFVLVGMLAGLAGISLMARIVTGQPQIGQGWELNVIAGVVIGGVSLFGGSGTIAGALVGLLLMQVVNSGLVTVGVNPYWQTLSVGVIMILAVTIDLIRRRAKIQAS